MPPIFVKALFRDTQKDNLVSMICQLSWPNGQISPLNVIHILNAMYVREGLKNGKIKAFSINGGGVSPASKFFWVQLQKHCLSPF